MSLKHLDSLPWTPAPNCFSLIQEKKTHLHSVTQAKNLSHPYLPSLLHVLWVTYQQSSWFYLRNTFWTWPLLRISTPTSLVEGTCPLAWSGPFFLTLCSLSSIWQPKWVFNNKSYHVTPHSRPSSSFPSHSRVKFKLLTMRYEALWALAPSSHSNLISSTCSCPFCAPGTPVFLQLYTHTKLVHALGPLFLLFVLPGKPFPRAWHDWLQVSSSPFLTTCSKIISPLPLIFSSSALYFCRAFTPVWHCYIYLFVVF